MDKAQAVTLTRLVKAMCPAQQIDEYTPDAWYEGALKAMDYDDAKAAVLTLSSQLRFIALADIAGEVKRVRRARFTDGYQAHLGASADPDDPAAFLEAVKSDVKAIGDGVPVEEIEAGSARPVGAVVAGLANRRSIEGAIS